jgi:hypothetical protein
MKKFSIIIAAMGLLMLGGCEDFLEVTPKASLDSATAISNVNDAQVALNGVYDGLQSSDYYGRNFVVIPDAAGDDIKLSPSNSGRFLYALQWNTVESTGDIAGFWNRAYITINRANNILDNIGGMTDGTDAQRNQIKGEALFLRALSHFDLVRFFAQQYNYTTDQSHLGVPYMETSVISQPARNTVAEVYTKIVQDLTDAISLMTIAPANAYSVSSWSAKALLSRVYLYMEDWVNASTLAQDVIDNSGKVLVPNANYLAMWSSENSTESLFELRFTETDNNATNQLGYIYQHQGYGDLWPTDDVLDMYVAGDVRNGWFYVNSGTVYTSKFIGKNASKPGQEVNTPILRLSEVYLIAAEAYAERSMWVEAQNMLNAIVQRANPAAAAIALTGDALKDRIKLERRKELLYEGHRLFDIARWKQDLVRGADCTLNVCSVTYPDDRFAFPIPKREMDANPNMEQNPGYN